MDVAAFRKEGGGIGDRTQNIGHDYTGGFKKNVLKPHLKKCWCIPPKQNGAFVAAMEDVLEVYQRPYSAEEPLDEKPYQLLAEARESLSMTTLHCKREDNEYVRKGTCSIFLWNEPLGKKRYVSASYQRTRQDWAREVKILLTEHYPDAKKVILVMDNLNTHTPASLYETFPAEEAGSLRQRLEIHYTPKHGSWLNIAEIELSALSMQCLNRRIDTMEKLNEELAAWQQERNMKPKAVKWQFFTPDARIKLHSLYPCI